MAASRMMGDLDVSKFLASSKRKERSGMKRHSRQHVIWQRRRWIARRLAMLEAWHRNPLFADVRAGFRERAGRYAKWNLGCSCRMCCGPKRREGRRAEKVRWRKEAWEDVAVALDF